MGERKKIGPVRWILGIVILFVTGFIWLLFQTGQVRALEVISRSMEPTLMVGDRILVWRAETGPIHRNELVIFRAPDDGLDMVKRVVGIPGDEIRIIQGRLEVNGQPAPSVTGANFTPQVLFRELTLAPNEFFVVGDNRGYSHDSMIFGPITRDSIFATVLYRYGPSGRIGRLQ